MRWRSRSRKVGLPESEIQSPFPSSNMGNQQGTDLVARSILLRVEDDEFL